MVRTLFASLIGLGLGLAPIPAQATTQDEVNVTLGADTQLWNDLFWLAVADQIRENCATIEARTLRATRYVWGVYNHARDYGYSREQIRAFQVHDTTRARMEAQLGAYFDEHGVRQGAPETYCTLGQAEIAAGSQAGELLRAR